MIVFWIIEWMSCFVEAIIGISVSAAVLSKNINWKGSLLAAGIMATIGWGMNQFQLFSFITTIVGISGIAVSSVVVYRTGWKDAIVISSAYFLLVYIIDFLSISIFAVFFQDRYLAGMIISTYSFFRVGVIVVSKTILFVVCWILTKKVFKYVRIQSWKTWVGIMVGTLCIYYLAVVTFHQADRNILIIWGLVLFLIFLGGYSGLQYMANMKKENELKFMEERNRLMAENARTMIQNYRDNQIFYHDLKNQHLVIENYLKNGEYEKAAEYMGVIRTMEQKVVLNAWTGIKTLDILIECKRKEAEKSGIAVTIVSEPIQLKITEQEMIALFGNLFDNGIEACRKNRPEKRWIRLAIRNVNEALILKISNPSDEIPCIERGELVSQKKQEGIHGLGMKSIKSIVEKYGAIIEAEYKEGTFSVIISFFD